MNPNYFLGLPIYERVALLENASDHDTFTTLISMHQICQAEFIITDLKQMESAK